MLSGYRILEQTWNPEQQAPLNPTARVSKLTANPVWHPMYPTPISANPGPY